MKTYHVFYTIPFGKSDIIINATSDINAKKIVLTALKNAIKEKHHKQIKITNVKVIKKKSSEERILGKKYR